MIKLRHLILVAILCLFGATGLHAEVKLPRILTSNMVLQRDAELKIWGWADKGESVEIKFNSQTVKTKANKSGQWAVKFKPMPFGGPYQMIVKGKKNTITLDNIMLGDVWICSGQSNMEWPTLLVNNAQQELKKANNPNIRLFQVGQGIAPYEREDLLESSGKWVECDSINVKRFSAVGYFFGKKLQNELNVPIGLINSSVGGTDIIAWTSIESMKKADWWEAKFKEKTPDDMAAEIKANDEATIKYNEAVKNDKGNAEKWWESDFAGEKEIDVPSAWYMTDLGNSDGIVWYYREFNVPEEVIGRFAQVSLGNIDDEDVVYINGKRIGSTRGWNVQRVYDLDDDVLKAGKNTIVVRNYNFWGGGGFQGKPEDIYCKVGNKKISLAGKWKHKIAALNKDFGVKFIGGNDYPALLYNAMIYPLHNYAIKGAIWYQGESNTWEAYRYGTTMFPNMIKGWRDRWGIEFPFYWVQLANFLPATDNPNQPSQWAELREAQTKTLAVPKTGEAITIDIGDAADIHPRNKQDVGLRLALNSLAKDYGKNVVYSGPVYKSARFENNRAILSFTSIGSGLMAKDRYGYLKGFSIAGADKVFHWAKAMITKNNEIVVFSENVPNPVAVRYAWADNPEDASLFNKEGLPAPPFRTDNWEISTQNVK